MRQGQANKRSRGRPGNRKPSSGRSFDSNGPDVKIRGTAAHIFEKYQALARDAQASGDRVMGENYLQHAEHYYRVMLASEGGVPNQFRPDGGRPQHRDDRPRHEGQNGGGNGGQQSATGDDGEDINGADVSIETPPVVANGGRSHPEAVTSQQADSVQEQPEAGDFPTLIDTSPQEPDKAEGPHAASDGGRRAPRRRRTTSRSPEGPADSAAVALSEGAPSGNGSASESDPPSGS